jgi:hypothetical protein
MRKKKIKINFKFFGPYFDPEDDFFVHFLRKKYNVIISDNPDYLFYSVYNTKIPPKDIEKIGRVIKKFSPEIYIWFRKMFSKIYGIFNKEKKIEGNFIKIFYGLETVIPDMKECDWAFGSHFEEHINHPKYMRLLPQIENYKSKKLGTPPLKKNINLVKAKEEKTKFCNFIYSQDVLSRNNFFKKLSKYKKIDAPGRCMTNMPPIGKHISPKKSRNANNFIEQKLSFLKQYKFTIAFENSSVSGWVTEKLAHPMMVNSIPIYVGHKDVSKDFNTKSFINYHDFNNMEDFIQHIIKVDNDDKLYEEYLKQPFYKKSKPYKNIYTENHKKLLKRFKEIFG